MISINDLTFEIGSRKLYDEANWHIKPGDKVGLVGANGTGKSTLLKLIVGEYSPTAGTISKPKDLKIGYLNQDLLSYESDKSILQVALEAFEKENKLNQEIEELIKRLETDHSESLINRLSEKQMEFEALGGYQIEFKAHEILAGLGFSDQEQQRPLSSFSGGWRMRVMLARILLQQPDILLLDEPTNHLDLPSIEWVESYLQSFTGAIVIVSHDRYFLDRIIAKTVEVHAGKLTLYAGTYSFYEEEKKLRQEIQKSEYKNQQAKIKQEERLIERFRAKASKAKMVQSRIKALERMDKVEDVEAENPTVNFQFKFSRPSGRNVVELEDISKSYPAVSILENTSARIENGDKIALIGANGKGKSTLLRIVAGSDDDFSGEHKFGHQVSTTFFAQHQLEALTLDNSILDELIAYAPQHSEMELRTILGSFLFTGDDVFKKIRVLSGGEKSRVALAKALTADANFLILDEPTNHLDITSVNILIQALEQFTGTFIVVSHDRYFLEQVANKIWYIENKEIKEYPGTYKEYQRWYAKRQSAETKAMPSVEKKKSVKKDPPRSHSETHEKKKLLKRKTTQLKSAEAEVDALHKKIEPLEKEMADPSNYADNKRIAELQKQHQELLDQLKNKEESWEALAMEIMELEEELAS